MSDKEALSRVKIDELLREASWRLTDDNGLRKNVVLEQCFRQGHKVQFTDYLLLDKYNRPLAVVEAKKVDFPLLSAKAQAMDYAKSLDVDYFYLSNGEEHYFGSMKDGVLHAVDSFHTQAELIAMSNDGAKFDALWDNSCDDTILADIKVPNIRDKAEYKDLNLRKEFISNNRIKILRDYQVDAVNAIIDSAEKGNSRFLLEMATGTGKTLTCAAIIELFLKTKNAHRVLFLVDRIELENQAKRAFDGVFDNGQHYTVNIYKEGRDNWRSAQIMVTTVQSLEANERYKTEFAPSDFDLIIVDEAHRTIGGKARDVFEYFIGYKIGLTATPKDYFRGVNEEQLLSNNLYEYDRRAYNDTYTTFGCVSGHPTYEFTLKDGVERGILVQPYAIDARTDISEQLLDEGLAIQTNTSSEMTEDEEAEQIYTSGDFERKLFSESTNEVFCRMFLENAKRDPLTGEIGKTIIFCVSQVHAGKIANLLNELIKEYEPNNWQKYDGHFAEQVTSSVSEHSKMTQLFTNDFNELNGTSTYLDGVDVDDYKTTKTRVCCTVSMMTIGYDCQDLLNICLMRPVLQPSEFIQIKGRGTRIFEFHLDKKSVKKDNFYFFDYFGNFERFENYDYDQKLKAPKKPSEPKETPPQGGGDDGSGEKETIELTCKDYAANIVGAQVGAEGMRIDVEFNKGTDIRVAMLADNELRQAVTSKNWDKVLAIINERYNNKHKYGYENNETLSKGMNLNRVPSWKELVELLYGVKESLKTKEQLLEETVIKCMQVFSVDKMKKKELRKLIEAYIESEEVRRCIDRSQIMQLDYTGVYSMSEFDYLGINPKIIASKLHEYIPQELLRSC